MSPRSQIVVTIGPASKDPAILDSLLAAGMGAVRLNFSWGTHDEHASVINFVRVRAGELGMRVPIIQDLAGSRMQYGVDHRFDRFAPRAISKKDIRDLHFGLSRGVDYVCLSFVGSASDMEDLKREIATRGSTTKVMAKIERREALERLEEIVDASHAIMIGRGDLGRSIPVEQVPFAQERIIKFCKAKRKPVITATQMFFSMVEEPEPTRAEITDVAYAILLGSDAVMLSEETARGRYPLEAVRMMARVVREAEGHVHPLTVNPL